MSSEGVVAWIGWVESGADSRFELDSVSGEGLIVGD